MAEHRAEVSPEQELNDLTDSDKEFGNINERQEKRVLALETKLYNLANFYLVFQGVILTAISQASSLKCHKWWIPFTLSLMTAMVNGFAFIYTLLKYVRTKEQLENNRLERTQVQQQIANLKQGKPKSGDCVRLGMGQEGVRSDPSKWFYRKIFICLVIIFLIGFTIMMLAACRIVLCSDCDKNPCKKDCCEND